MRYDFAPMEGITGALFRRLHPGEELVVEPVLPRGGPLLYALPLPYPGPCFHAS